jgi:putative flippase GtrA
MPEEIAAAIALAVLLVVGFILSRRFVFSSTGKLFGQAWRFLLIAVAARATEYVVFLGFFLLLGVNYLYALIVTLGISFGFKFLFYRNWIFNDRD